MLRQYKCSSWLAESSALVRLLAGLLVGVNGFFSSIWIGITTVFNNVVFSLQHGGLHFMVIVSGADFTIQCPLRLRVKYLTVFQSSGISISTFTPNSAVLRRIFTGAWNLIVGVWGAAGWFGSTWGGIVGVFSVVAGWFDGVFRGA